MKNQKKMKASELRIGNYFQDETGIHCLRRIEFEEDGVAFTLLYGNSSTTGEYSWDDEAEPIPLTEDWLIKFGFIHKSNTHRNICYQLPSWDCVFLKPNRFIHGRIEVELNYVHQLQNLYFALTGNELTIKP